MKPPSPTAEGFRAAYRRPAVILAEITWRWVLGATVLAVFTFYGVEFLDTLPVTNADALLIRSRQPLLIGQAIEHILRGSLHRAVFGALLATSALALLWIIAASLGRFATTRAVLEYFHSDEDARSRREPSGVEGRFEPAKRRPIRALIDLNFLRAVVVLAAFLGLAGSAILSSLVSTDKNPRPDLAVIIFLLLAGIVLIAGWLLNWWLSFAAIFAVRNGKDAVGSITAAATLARERTGAVLAVSTWTGLAHLVVLSIASSALPFVLTSLGILPSRVVSAGVVLMALAYFAVVDWLYVARLCGYVCIAEMPEVMSAEAEHPPVSLGGAGAAREGEIDTDEPILSDVPNLAQ
ncbi:MAG TPA: hypothetical protein VGG14_06125 [Candidatus Sulfotelmatobacter sp.]